MASIIGDELWGREGKEIYAVIGRYRSIHISDITLLFLESWQIFIELKIKEILI